jgi:hypothetical protein
VEAGEWQAPGLSQKTKKEKAIYKECMKYMTAGITKEIIPQKIYYT